MHRAGEGPVNKGALALLLHRLGWETGTWYVAAPVRSAVFLVATEAQLKVFVPTFQG